MNYIELERCIFFSPALNKCVAAPHEMIEHYPAFECPECRRTKAKKERDEFQDRNRRRFKWKV
jgi:hypothetical protein